MDTQKFILKADEIDAMQGEEKVHYLNSNAIRINKSLGDATGLNHLGVHMIYVEPGHDSTEYHIHQYEEECLYILSGTATAILGDDEYSVAAGDFIALPRNTIAHNVVNTGNETLVALVIGQRLEQDVADYPKLGKRLYRNSGK